MKQTDKQTNKPETPKVWLVKRHNYFGKIRKDMPKIGGVVLLGVCDVSFGSIRAVRSLIPKKHVRQESHSVLIQSIS
jgi:hypothetical protein